MYCMWCKYLLIGVGSYAAVYKCELIPYGLIYMTDYIYLIFMLYNYLRIYWFVSDSFYMLKCFIVSK